MNRYVDIHSHILPGIDDGASDWEESLKMLQIAQAEGIGFIIATPHYGLFNQGFDINQARELVSEINMRADELGIEVEVALGNEIYYLPGAVNHVIDGRAATLAGTRYVLIEFSEDVSVDIAEQAVLEFTASGYRPIIAHVERYRHLFDRNLVAIRRLKEFGAYFQINTRSLTDKQHKRLFARNTDRINCAVELLKEGMVDLVATDAHNMGNRAPLMKDAIDNMRMLIGRAKTNRILCGNTLAILENDYISY